MWVLFATAPPLSVNSGWVFQPGRFPRTYAYKKDAQAGAEEAKRKGGTQVEVLRVDKSMKALLALDLKKNLIVRCEREGAVFGVTPVKTGKTDYDTNGDRTILCPTCGRTYLYHNGGEYADGIVGWYSDRALTILHNPVSQD